MVAVEKSLWGLVLLKSPRFLIRVWFGTEKKREEMNKKEKKNLLLHSRHDIKVRNVWVTSAFV